MKRSNQDFYTSSAKIHNSAKNNFGFRRASATLKQNYIIIKMIFLTSTTTTMKTTTTTTLRTALFALLTMLISFPVFAADYEATMKANLQKLGEAKTLTDYTALASQFERIANAEKDKWQPAYYAVLCYLNAVTMLQLTEDEKSAQLDKAQPIMDNLKKSFKTESEIFALQGFLYEMRIMGMTSAMKYSPLATETLEEAESLNPSNPRVYYLQGMNIFHTPKAFGGGKEKAKPLFEKAAALFENAKPATALDPTWGAEYNKRMIEQCNAASE